MLTRNPYGLATEHNTDMNFQDLCENQYHSSKDTCLPAITAPMTNFLWFLGRKILAMLWHYKLICLESSLSQAPQS